MKGILGRKIGMTQVFASNGKLVPVTVVEVEPNVVSQIKTKENDGYDAIQLAAVTKKEKKANKPEMGHLKKANTSPKRFLKELRGVDVSEYSLGQELKADLFSLGEMVDVTGTSKGKGTQGVIKRWNQSRGPMGHGSQYHRGVGSLGTLLPMRVLPGKKMPGRMGGEQVTVQNLEVIQIDLENNVILIKGNVPGPKNSLVFIKSAIKKNGKINPETVLVSYVTEEANDNTADVEEVVEEAPVTEEVVEEAPAVEEVVEEVSTVEENSEETNKEAE